MRRLQLFILCIIVFMTSSPTDEQIIDDDRDFDPNSCYDETRNVTMKKGETMQREGKCSALSCTGSTSNNGEVISNYVNQECSKKEVKPGCTVIPGNMSEPFPKCCPQLKCRKESTPMTERCLDPVTNKEVKRGDKVKAPDGECAVYECVGAELNSTTGMYSSRLFKHMCKTYKLKPFCFFEPGVQSAPYPFCCPRELCLSDTARKPVHSIYRRSTRTKAKSPEKMSSSSSSSSSVNEYLTIKDGEVLVNKRLSAYSTDSSGGPSKTVAINEARKYRRSGKLADVNASFNSSSSAAASSTSSNDEVMTPDGGKLERKKSSSSSAVSAATSTSVKKKGKRKGALNTANTAASTSSSAQEKMTGEKGSMSMDSSFTSSSSSSSTSLSLDLPSSRIIASKSDDTCSRCEDKSRCLPCAQMANKHYTPSSGGSANNPAPTSSATSSVLTADSSSSNNSASASNVTSANINADGSTSNSASSQAENATNSDAYSNKTVVKTGADGSSSNSTSSEAQSAANSAASSNKTLVETGADGSLLSSASSVASNSGKVDSSSNKTSVEVGADGSSLNSASSSSATAENSALSSNITGVQVNPDGSSVNVASSLVMAANSTGSTSNKEIVKVDPNGQTVQSISQSSSSQSSSSSVVSSNSAVISKSAEGNS